MTPGQARAALFGFSLLLAGVAVNALFMQSGPSATRPVAERKQSRPVAERPRKAPDVKDTRRSSPRVSEAAPEDAPALRIARFAPDSGRLDGMPEIAEEPADTETVRAIQRELIQRGYGPLAGDGRMGLATRAAIMAYEYDQVLPLTGEASDRLLKRVLLGASTGADTTSARKVASAEAERVIRMVQQWLATLGYRAGRVDGRLGDDTIKAIRDFEVDKGLVPAGRVSAELVGRLSEAAGTTRAAVVR